MFRFENEYILYALLLIPLLIALYIYVRLKRKKTWTTYGDYPLLKTMFPDMSNRVKTLKFILLCLIYIVLVFALANPQLGASVEKGKRKGIDVMFCLDVSNSMLAQDLSPNRLEAAKRAMLSFIDKLKGDRIGLVVFAGKAFVQLPITSDYAAAKTFISHVSTQSINTQGTDIGTAIDLAASSMLTHQKANQTPQKSATNKVIVVISDGEDHIEDAVEITKSAYKQGINTFTIGIGSSLGVPIPVKTQGGKTVYKKDKEGNTVMTRLNENLLKEIAKTGNGTYIHATNANVGFDMLYKELEKIEKKEIEDVIFSKYNNYYYIPLWIVFFLLIIETLLYDRKIIRLSHFSWINKRIASSILIVFLCGIFSLQAQTRDELKHLRKGNKLYFQAQDLEKEADKLQQKNKELNQIESIKKKQEAQSLYEKASTSYLKSNASNSDYYKSIFNLGSSLYKQGKYEDAAALFDKINSMDAMDKKTKAKAYHNLGNSLLQQKKYQESIDAYKNALKINPSDKDTKYNLEYAKRMMAIQQQQQQQQQQNQQQDKQEKKEDKNEQQQQQQQQQEQDKNKEKNKEKREENKQKNKDTERQLDALQQNERRTQEKVKEAEMRKVKKEKQEKDW